MIDDIECPLCSNEECQHFYRDNQRDYFCCAECQLVFVLPDQRLSVEEEKAVYDLHENYPDDPGYRKFLSRIYAPVCERIKPPARGLDFGPGPGPALSVMFAEAGYDMTVYDPVYAPDKTALAAHYNFITATEVFEHLYHPGNDLKKIFSLLSPHGLMAVMTKRIPAEEDFPEWHYIRDPTHVCFYAEKTFQWIAAHYNFRPEFLTTDICLLQKLD